MSDLDLTRITPRDVVKAGYCVLGAREWFRLTNNDFRDFVRRGYIEVANCPPNDAMVTHILEVKARG